jgi:hypothetical protein
MVVKAVEISIQKESSRCLRCDTEFLHDQKHHSLLKIEGKDFLREDYCMACWTEHINSNSTGAAYSSWETKFRDPSVAKATPQEQFVPMLNLCYESIAEGGPAGEAMAYMCALILRRQKIFKFIREGREEQEPHRSVLIFLDKHNDTQIGIVDPGLTDSQLQEVKQALEEKIGPEKDENDDEQSGYA